MLSGRTIQGRPILDQVDHVKKSRLLLIEADPGGNRDSFPLASLLSGAASEHC